jgi:hypothetical protein
MMEEVIRRTNKEAAKWIRGICIGYGSVTNL